MFYIKVVEASEDEHASFQEFAKTPCQVYDSCYVDTERLCFDLTSGTRLEFSKINIKCKSVRLIDLWGYSGLDLTKVHCEELQIVLKHRLERFCLPPLPETLKLLKISARDCYVDFSRLKKSSLTQVVLENVHPECVDSLYSCARNFGFDIQRPNIAVELVNWS